MFKWNPFFKITLLTISLIIFAIGCGSTQDDDESLDAYVKAIDLSKNTLSVSVPLPLDNTTQEYEKKGQVTLDPATSPVPFNKIKGILMFVRDASGQPIFIGHSTDQDTVSTGAVNINQRNNSQINSLSNGDRIWIADKKNKNQYLSIITVLQEPRMNIHIDLIRFKEDPQHPENTGSDSFGPIYKPGQESVQIYLHFQQKK